MNESHVELTEDKRQDGDFQKLDKKSPTNPLSGRQVLKQKREYHDSTKEDDSDSRSLDERVTKQKSAKLNPKILIAAITGAALLLVVCSVGGLSMKKAKEEEAARHAEELLQEEEEQSFSYTAEEKEALRLVGYTGDEIETFEFEQKDAQSIVDEAEEARQEKYEEEVKPFFDGASEEFKELYDDTWYGQKEIQVDEDTSSYGYYNKNLNVDYEKLPPRGHQLFIKLYLRNGDAVFMTVTPERYLELPDSGNMVVAMKYTKLGNGTSIITGMEEIITD